MLEEKDRSDDNLEGKQGKIMKNKQTKTGREGGGKKRRRGSSKVMRMM